MGIVNQQTSIAKTVGINKVVNLDVQKDVNAFVNLTGTLATAEASADAVGGFAGPIDDGFTLVDFVGDLSREEIHQEWWDRALNFPTGDFSYAEPDGRLQSVGQDVPGVFLVDGSGGGPVSRSFAVQFGDTLAFPLVNLGLVVEDLAEDEDGNGVPDIEEFVPEQFDTIIMDSLSLTVDGEEVPLDDLLLTRATTGIFELPVVDGGVLDVFFDDDVETVFGSFDGYFVLLEGLDPGPHTIEFRGERDTGFVSDVTINIEVRQVQAALAETDTFAQATEAGASSFSESLAAVSFDDLIA